MFATQQLALRIRSPWSRSTECALQGKDKSGQPMTSNDNKNQKDAILKLTFSYVGRILSRMQYNQMCCRSAVVKFLLLLETNNLDLKKRKL